MSTVIPLQAERRQRHWLMAATTIEWSSFLHLTNSFLQTSLSGLVVQTGDKVELDTVDFVE